MTTTAIIMLIVAILVIWGGLALAIVNLATRGDSAAAVRKLAFDEAGFTSADDVSRIDRLLANGDRAEAELASNIYADHLTR